MRKPTVLEQIRDELKEIKNRLPAIITPVKPICSQDGRFIRNADGTVTDNQLKLIWYPTLSSKHNWKDAAKECEKIGCRLPTTHELFSLVDVTKYSPAINKEIFPETKTDDWYWTSDVCPWYADDGRIVYFYNGYVGYYGKGYDSYVRPVRSSQ